MNRQRIISSIQSTTSTRCFSSASQSEEDILRTTQVASIALSSLLSALQTASRTPATDIQAYAQSASENLKHVHGEIARTHTRPSPLAGLTSATFGLAGMALAAVPPRIRHACIGGVYDAIGTMHTEHLRDLLEREHGDAQEKKEEEEEEGRKANRTEELKTLTKTLRDVKFGPPEGIPSSTRATELLLRAYMNKELNVDAATVAGATTNQLVTHLLHASKTL